MTSDSSDSVKSSMSSLTPSSLLTLDDLQQSASRTRGPERPPPLPGPEMPEMAGQSPAETGGLVNASPSPAALRGSATAQAGPASGLQATAPPRPTGSTLDPPARSTEDTMVAILLQLQQQQQQAQRVHAEQMLLMQHQRTTFKLNFCMT